MSELIIRELPLRPYDGLAQAKPRYQHAIDQGVREVSAVDSNAGASRLAVRYSRRRPHRLGLDL